MEFFKELNLIESELSSQREVLHAINVVNNLYSEWKKQGRRKNAVDIITTTANKLSTLDPAILAKLHDASRVKLAALLIRCFDIPCWKHVSMKERLYKKLADILAIAQNYDGGTDTGGTVKEVIMTRLSASISHNSENKEVFVTYEPSTNKTYIRYLFGAEAPERIYRMQLLMIPGSFDEVVDILTINHEKAARRYASEKTE